MVTSLARCLTQCSGSRFFFEHAIHRNFCGRISSLSPTQCFSSHFYRACHPLKFLWSHLQPATNPMLGITILLSLLPTQILVVTSPACNQPNARDHAYFEPATHSNSCGHISSLQPTQCSRSRLFWACHPLKFLWSHLQPATNPMLAITLILSLPPTQILVVTSPACNQPNARDHASFEPATHSNSCGHISSLQPTQCSGSRFFWACHPLKFLWSHLQPATNPMLGITLLLSLPPSQILVVTSPACNQPNARDHASFEPATHSNSSGHISSFLPTQCLVSRFFWEWHQRKFCGHTSKLPPPTQCSGLHFFWAWYPLKLF